MSVEKKGKRETEEEEEGTAASGDLDRESGEDSCRPAVCWIFLHLTRTSLPSPSLLQSLITTLRQIDKVTSRRKGKKRENSVNTMLLLIGEGNFNQLSRTYTIRNEIFRTAIPTGKETACFARNFKGNLLASEYRIEKAYARQ
ncbi:hypothetical protein CDAR_199891 [Caerostris darwini]|uniref:Uncharacterized protein n=1 Tax=Caerostris darwini TaxID=1538125 RepID=A0AAV4QXW7_9ARAC|nr:hypothetical protein CDAR_199891 [Caerostris darwini]